MKRKLLLLHSLALLLLGPANAQYNRTFTDDGQKSVDIVDASDASGAYTCVLSTSSSYPVILHKLDFAGNPVTPDFEYAVNNPDLSVQPTQLLHTPSGEFMVVGTIYHHRSGIGNPFAARFDNGCNMMWMYEYNSGNTQGIGEVNICRVEDDPTTPESFILATNSPGPSTAPGVFDDAINALRIRFDGSLVWNYKYYPPASPILPATNYVTDVPETIVYLHPTDGRSRYYIGGTSLLQTGSGGSFRYGFGMSIRKDGSVADAYMQMPIYGMRSQHAIYDHGNYIAAAFTATNPGIPSTSASVIGIAIIDVASQLVFSRAHFYACANCTESAGLGIREDQTQDHYIVSCEVYHPNPGGGASACAAMLKVNRTSVPSMNPPVFFHEYNYLTQTRNTNIISLTNGGTENYVMAEGLFAPPYGSRIVSTDTAGNACGARPLGNTYLTKLYTTDTGKYTQAGPFAGQTPLIAFRSTGPTVTDCDPSNANQYRHHQHLPETSLFSVYPTLLSSEQSISLDIALQQPAALDVSAYSTDGRLLARQRIHALAGNHHLPVDVSALGSGNFLLRITASDGSLSRTVKLSRL